MDKSNRNTQQTQTASLKLRITQPEMHIPAPAILVYVVIMLVAVVGAIIMDGQVQDWIIGTYVVVLMVIGLYFMFAIKVARQWEKAVMLRLGKFRGLRGPGIFWMIPIMDSASSWIDQRVMVSPGGDPVEPAFKKLELVAAKLLGRAFQQHHREGLFLQHLVCKKLVRHLDQVVLPEFRHDGSAKPPGYHA